MDMHYTDRLLHVDPLFISTDGEKRQRRSCLRNTAKEQRHAQGVQENDWLEN